jgi:hypothetical protein
MRRFPPKEVSRGRSNATYSSLRVILPALLFSTSLGDVGHAQTALKVLGVNRVGHGIETEMRYAQSHGDGMSARYQLFIRNASSETLTLEGNASPLINGREAHDWHRSGAFSWFHFPAQDSTHPKKIPPGSLMVWQFNGKDDSWLSPSGYAMKSTDLDTVVGNAVQDVWIETVHFTGSGHSILPDRAVIHLFNRSSKGYRIEDAVFWQAAPHGPWQFLYPGTPIRPDATFPNDGRLDPGGNAIMTIGSDRLRLGHAAMQVALRDSDGARLELWAHLKVRREAFDISAGWANYPVDGKPAFLKPGFLKTMKSLYVNTAHYNGQAGYSDNDSLFGIQPLKYFGNLHPWERYDHDSLLKRIHGIEFLGEPQYGGGTPVDPQKVLMQLLPYAPSRIPTTLTHSEERIWRHYAGLSDYPHYDAYRVSAPSADEWTMYDRWNGRRIAWGAPLETIGNMTRSLKALNRPMPIAYWSQGPHEGWEVYGGRRLTSPTASELRVQAFHALASGISSLYWFNLSYASLRKYPSLMGPMQRIGREIRLLEDFYLTGTQWVYERTFDKGKPGWDLSTFVSPEGLLLFALDLDYRADALTKTFVFTPDRLVDLRFKVPDWIDAGWQLWKLEEDGLKRLGWSPGPETSLAFKDMITEVGIYILLPDARSSDGLLRKWELLKNREAGSDFDPAGNPAHRREFMGWKKITN